MTTAKLLGFILNRYIKTYSAATEAYATLGDPVRGSRANEFLECVQRELQALSTYETKIKQIKPTLAQFRNLARTIVPVNSLPPEILLRVFEQIHGSWIYSQRDRCSINRPARSTLAAPLVVFSHVCVRWRRIALSSPVLWSHLNITTSQLQRPSFDKILTYCEFLASRTGSLGTSLRIDVVPNVTPDILANSIKLGRLYASTGKGLEKLRLDNWTNRNKFFSTIGLSLTSLKPQALKQLTLVNHSVAGASPTGILLDNAQAKAMDPCLRYITSLHLIDVCLPCSNSAYSGLNDLRLIASGGRYREFSVTTSQLRTILSSSPGLRIFHFNYQINLRGRALNGDPNHTTQIPLEELEEVNIRGMANGHEHLLELISPGTKPISLSITGAGQNHNPLHNDHPIPTSVLAFQERSNVCELYIEHQSASPMTFPFPSLTRNPLTKLRVLGLKGFALNQTETTSSGQYSSSRLEALRLRNCIIYPEVLRGLVSAYAVRTVYVYNCDLAVGSKFVVPNLRDSKWKNKLAEMIPGAIFHDSPEPRSVGEWEYWEAPGAYT